MNTHTQQAITGLDAELEDSRALDAFSRLYALHDAHGSYEGYKRLDDTDKRITYDYLHRIGFTARQFPEAAKRSYWLDSEIAWGEQELTRRKSLIAKIQKPQAYKRPTQPSDPTAREIRRIYRMKCRFQSGKLRQYNASDAAIIERWRAAEQTASAKSL